jgi:hypothetical protein
MCGRPDSLRDMTPANVARIVERRDQAAFVDLLRAADTEFEDAAFEAALATALRAEPRLIDLWDTWSGDQRWTPSAAVNGVRTAWVTPGGASEHHRVHPDRAAAVADFIHRMAAWLARREIIAVDR